jgi:hypothetical protein
MRADCPVKTNLIFHLLADHGNPTNWRAVRGSVTVATPNTGTPTTTIVNGRRGIRTTTAQHYRFNIASGSIDGAVSVYAIAGQSGSGDGLQFCRSLNEGAASSLMSICTWRPTDGRISIYFDPVGGRIRSLVASSGAIGSELFTATSIYQGGAGNGTFWINSVERTNATTTDLAARTGTGVFLDVGVSSGVNVYEILIFSGAHDATTRARVEAYLRFKREGRVA